MKLVIEPSVCVITPTIGKTELTRAMKSVAEQTYSNLTYLIVIDGDKFWEATHKVLAIDTVKSNVKVTTAPDITLALIICMVIAYMLHIRIWLMPIISFF